MSTNEELLREISELLVDSSLGYAEAARRTDDERLKVLLRGLGEARKPMAADLRQAMGISGGAPTSGTFKGTLHRLWMATRDIVSNTDDVDMLAECERGEAYLIGRYDAALRTMGSMEGIGRSLSEQKASLLVSLGEVQGLTATFSHHGR